MCVVCMCWYIHDRGHVCDSPGGILLESALFFYPWFRRIELRSSGVVICLLSRLTSFSFI